LQTGGNPSVKVANTPWVQGVGYSPGAVQRRSLLLLNCCLRYLTLRIIFRKEHNELSSYVK